MESIENILEEIEFNTMNNIVVKDYDVNDKLKQYKINKAIMNNFMPYMIIQRMMYEQMMIEDIPG